MTSPGTAIPCHASGTIAPVVWRSGYQHEPAATLPAAEAAEKPLPGRVSFDRFTVVPDQRLLLRDDEPVRIGARAFDILLALLRRAGALVTKEELIAEVWPSTFVDAGNVRVQMVALRKALGDADGRLINTDAGRGYRFLPPLSHVAEQPAPEQAAPPAIASEYSPPVPRLLGAMTTIIGRDEIIRHLLAQLPNRRLITIIGPGGIGKTRVAAACTQMLADSYRDGAHFFDLTPASDPDSVVPMLAQSLGIAVGNGDPLPAVVRELRTREMLLTVDNSEHVIDAAARLVEAITTGAPGVHIIATSREALRVMGEWVRVLPPLPSPAESQDITAAEALSYPAVRLFVERAAAVRHDFLMGDAEAPLVAEICRRLDGVPLAIELAAATLHAFSLEWLAAHLDDPLPILNHGRRTAAPRHQSLSATLDWSYDLLTDHERATLQRVAALPGDFTMADAIGAAANAGMADGQVVYAVGGLVSKSLATLDVSGPVTRYRLPQAIRVYAHAKMVNGTGRSGSGPCGGGGNLD